MVDNQLENLKFPIGRFTAPEKITQELIDNWLNEIAALPGKMSAISMSLAEEQLDLPYRPGGWTARQVIHHVPDSHLNAYIRFKLTLTEDLPVIKPYLEERWAELSDSKKAPVEMSLSLLDAVHKKWSVVLKNMSPSDFERKYFHPESQKEFSLKTALAMYAWHGNHHLAHIGLVTGK